MTGVKLFFLYFFQNCIFLRIKLVSQILLNVVQSTFNDSAFQNFVQVPLSPSKSSKRYYSKNNK